MLSLCLSIWFVVSWVFPQNVVELHVVDLVGSFGLESLLDQIVFAFCQLELKVVENWSETGEIDETRTAFVLVLEVGLD